jgi:coproporphyrinogen III oxidase-like Fe-S oxidoreductase
MQTADLRGDRVWLEGLLEETVFLRMRTKEGLDLGAVSDAFGAGAAAALREAGLRLVPSGHVALSPDGSRLQIVGPAGFMFEHAIAAELISSLP